MQELERTQNKKRLLSILKKGLKCFPKSDYDTEERELIGDYLFELSEIVNIDFKDNLNKWLHGFALVSFLKVASLFKKKTNEKRRTK